MPQDLMSFFICLALLENAIFILLDKAGAVTKYQQRRPRFMPQSCNFCFFFWLTLLILTALHLRYNGFEISLTQCLTIIYQALIVSVLAIFFKPGKAF